MPIDIMLLREYYTCSEGNRAIDIYGCANRPPTSSLKQGIIMTDLEYIEQFEPEYIPDPIEPYEEF